MSTFTKLAAFPAGYFRATSRWLLNNRRDIVKRIAVLNAEIERIGFIRVVYEAVKADDGSLKRSENRIGFGVTQGSTLEKLVQAYIAQGGNPYDISPFKYPDSHEILSLDSTGKPILSQEYPEGGVVAPVSAQPNSPSDEPGETGYGAYRGGWLNSPRYYPARMGGRISRGAWDANSVVKSMHALRAWANQDIKERLQDMEWRILKQCDLREQLTQERDEVLLQAFAGTLNGVAGFNPDQINRGLLVQNILADMNDLIFEQTPSGLAYRANVQTGLLYFVFPDLPSEERDPMGA